MTALEVMKTAKGEAMGSFKNYLVFLRTTLKGVHEAYDGKETGPQLTRPVGKQHEIRGLV